MIRKSTRLPSFFFFFLVAVTEQMLVIRKRNESSVVGQIADDLLAWVSNH